MMLSLKDLKGLSLSEIIQKTSSEDLCIQQLTELRSDIDNLLLHNREQREINSKLKLDIPILKQKNEILLKQYKKATEKANQRESRIAERQQAQREAERQQAQREEERQQAQREAGRQESQSQQDQREAERQESQSQQDQREAERQESKKAYECVRPVGDGISIQEFSKRRIFSCDPVNIPVDETIDNNITVDNDGNIGGTFERKQLCSRMCLVDNDKDPSVTDDIKAADEEMDLSLIHI